MLSGPEPVLVAPGPRTRLLGPVLAIEAVTEDDSGMYRCSASNVGGEASAELRLVVTSTLQVEVSPSMLSVHIGGTAEFKCNVHARVSHIISLLFLSLSTPTHPLSAIITLSL